MMRPYITLAVFAALSLASCRGGAGKAEQTENTTPAERLVQRMHCLTDSGAMMFGHHDATFYGHGWQFEEGRCDVREVCGDLPAVLSTDLAWIEVDSAVNIERIPFEAMRREIAAHHARGGITALCWHPHNPRTLGSSWDNDTLSSPFPGIVTPGDTLNTRYREWAAKTADFILSLTDSTGNRVPVIWRPFHEMNGTWFWWGAQNATPEQYKALWTEMRGVFDEKGVDNAVWAYSPDKCRTAGEYFAAYPGDDKVDILGADIYMFDGEKGIDTWRDYVASEFAVMADHAAHTGQLLAFTETGAESVPVADWYDAVLLTALQPYNVAYTVAWRNSPVMEHHYYMPYKGHPGEESFKRFHASGRTLFLSDITNTRN